MGTISDQGITTNHYIVISNTKSIYISSRIEPRIKFTRAMDFKAIHEYLKNVQSLRALLRIVGMNNCKNMYLQPLVVHTLTPSIMIKNAVNAIHSLVRKNPREFTSMLVSLIFTSSN